jgi:hypothetical protein
MALGTYHNDESFAFAGHDDGGWDGPRVGSGRTAGSSGSGGRWIKDATPHGGGIPLIRYGLPRNPTRGAVRIRLLLLLLCGSCVVLVVVGRGWVWRRLVSTGSCLVWRVGIVQERWLLLLLLGCEMVRIGRCRIRHGGRLCRHRMSGCGLPGSGGRTGTRYTTIVVVVVVIGRRSTPSATTSTSRIRRIWRRHENSIRVNTRYL